MVSCDPGKWALGVALWMRDDVKSPWSLKHAYATETPKREIQAEHSFLQPMGWHAAAKSIFDTLPRSPDFLVLETMTIYTKGNSDPRDLLYLQGICGVLVGLCVGSKYIGMEPKSWKQSIPRDVLGARIEAKLKASGEWDRCVSVPRLKDSINDMCHAVGLGRVAVERKLPDLLFPEQKT